MTIIDSAAARVPAGSDTHASAPPIVVAEGLVKRFGTFTAVDGVDFVVQPGEFFGMLGPNGAGKSTTMRMIYRVTPMDGGRLVVNGLEAGRHDREIKRLLGVVPQMDNLDEELNVLDNLLLYARFNDIPWAVAKRRAAELLAFAELDGKATAGVRTLSGGMKRRLTLARGLMNDPRVVILDEPTTGLDPQVRLTLWDKLDELRSRGVTLIMSTHYMDEAERLCDRLVIMDGGRIIAQGTPRALIREHVAAQVVEVRSDRARLERIERHARELQLDALRAGDRLSVFVADGRAALEALEGRAGEAIEAFVRPGNLEDVFLNLTGRSLRE